MNPTPNKIIPLDLGGVNSYLLSTPGGFVLTDTGGHMTTDRKFDSRWERLTELLADAGCAKGNLRLIFLTHGHNDHAANAARLREEFGCPIAMHFGDLSLVEDPTLERMMTGFQYRSAELRQMFAQNRQMIVKITQKTLDRFERFSPDIELTDGLRMDAFGLEASVVHLPGHTAGSVGLLFSDGSLLAGDTFVNLQKPETSLNATDFALLAQSVVRLKGTKVQTVYPGHGSAFAFDEWTE